MITTMDKGKSIQTSPSEKERIDTQKQLGKHMYDLLFHPGSPEEVIEKESYEEALDRKPSFKGRLAKGDKKISPAAYLQEYRKKDRGHFVCPFF